jgi:hypothetical protein
MFCGSLLVLLMFHLVFSFIFGRLPTSKMLLGMSLENVGKQKLGVLLVMRFACFQPTFLFSLGPFLRANPFDAHLTPVLYVFSQLMK